MSSVIEVCVAIATGVILVLAVFAIRTLVRFARAGEQASETVKTLDALLRDATDTSREIRGLVESLETVSASLTKAAGQLGGVAERAASVSNDVLDEVEAPVRRAVSLMRGVRRGVGWIGDRIASRLSATQDGAGRVMTAGGGE